MKKISIWILFLSFFFIQTSIAEEEKFLSLKNNKVNVRYGPSFDFEIKYIYKKINLTLKQIDKKENWRRVIDLKNNSGWIHSSQLNEEANSIIILKDKILFQKPSNFSKPMARLEEGRLLVIKNCKKEWCNVTTDNYTGWIKTTHVWGSTK